jgi:hypothetical protein
MCDSVVWIQVTQYMAQQYVLINSKIKFPVPQKVQNFLTSLATIRFPKKTLLHFIIYS